MNRYTGSRVDDLKGGGEAGIEVDQSQALGHYLAATEHQLYSRLKYRADFPQRIITIARFQ